MSSEMTNINIRLKQDVKNDAEELFDKMGMNMTTAINVFLRQAIREQRIPFEIRLEAPNALTRAALIEGDRIARDPNVRGYRSMAALKAALEDDEE